MINDFSVHDGDLLLELVSGITTLTVAADLDLQGLGALAGALDRAAAMTANELVMELAACSFVCSRAFPLIEASAYELQESEARLVVRGQPSSFDLVSKCVGSYPFDFA